MLQGTIHTQSPAEIHSVLSFTTISTPAHIKHCTRFYVEVRSILSWLFTHHTQLHTSTYFCLSTCGHIVMVINYFEVFWEQCNLCVGTKSCMYLNVNVVSYCCIQFKCGLYLISLLPTLLPHWKPWFLRLQAVLRRCGVMYILSHQVSTWSWKTSQS